MNPSPDEMVDASLGRSVAMQAVIGKRHRWRSVSPRDRLRVPIAAFPALLKDAPVAPPAQFWASLNFVLLLLILSGMWVWAIQPWHSALSQYRCCWVWPRTKPSRAFGMECRFQASPKSGSTCMWLFQVNYTPLTLCACNEDQPLCTRFFSQKLCVLRSHQKPD